MQSYFAGMADTKKRFESFYPLQYLSEYPVITKPRFRRLAFDNLNTPYVGIKTMLLEAFYGPLKLKSFAQKRKANERRMADIHNIPRDEIKDMVRIASAGRWKMHYTYVDFFNDVSPSESPLITIEENIRTQYVLSLIVQRNAINY